MLRMGVWSTPVKHMALAVLALAACTESSAPPRAPTAHAAERVPGKSDAGTDENMANEALQTGVEAVLYGLPLVMMNLTMQNMTNVESPKGMAAPVNQFAHAPVFPSAAFKQVVRANVDTLYSSAFLDLSREPLVLSVPQTDRYHLLPMFDAWTNVFASPGTRTSGNGATNIVIVGPDWNGTLPSGLQVVRSPTNVVWILGRTQTNGPSDYAVVHSIQAGYKLVPLSGFGKAYTPPRHTVDPAFDSKTPPVDKLKAMSAATYFDMLARLMKANPPPASDAPILAKLATIGIIPGQPFDASRLDPAVAAALDRSLGLALKSAVAAAKENDKVLIHGWYVPPMTVGNYGTDYRTRALIALVAFGANLAADAVYPTTYLDADGQPLEGSNHYVLHFEPGQTPPANAFWSVTLYDAESFFVANPIDRYAVSSWMRLKRGSDGSLDIYVQHDSPGKENEANWLPAPEGAFNMTLRMYWPKDKPPSVLDGSWTPPAVKRLATRVNR